MQRLPSVARERWVHGAWHKAVICSPGSATVSMTSIEGTAVIQHGSPQVPLQILVVCRLIEGMNSTGCLYALLQLVRFPRVCKILRRALRDPDSTVA